MNPLHSFAKIQTWVRERQAIRPLGPNYHRVPAGAVELDGRDESPDIVLQFAGRPLYSVVDDRSLQGGPLRIFSSVALLDEHLAGVANESQSATISNHAATTKAAFCRRYNSRWQEINRLTKGNGFVEFYEHANIDGCSWYIPDTKPEGALRQFKACKTLGLFGGKTPEKQISSVDCSSSYSRIALLDDFTFPGASALIMPSFTRVSDLSDPKWGGWNDRAVAFMRFCEPV